MMDSWRRIFRTIRGAGIMALTLSCLALAGRVIIGWLVVVMLQH